MIVGTHTEGSNPPTRKGPALTKAPKDQTLQAPRSHGGFFLLPGKDRYQTKRGLVTDYQAKILEHLLYNPLIRTTRQQLVDDLLGYPKPPGEGTAACAIFVALSNLPNLLLCQTGLRMPWPEAVILPATVFTVLSILKIGANSQVLRIAAERIIAGVQHKIVLAYDPVLVQS